MARRRNMLKGFYTAASGMIAQQRRTEMLTNNMSNANTPGYKADQSSVRSFPKMLLSRANYATIPVEKQLQWGSLTPIGGLSTGVYVQETNPLFSQGDIKQTDIKTDIALVNGNLPINRQTGLPGSVFFTVQNDNGQVRYTRNGNFTLDGQGFLTTPNGNYVLDVNNQRIQLESDQFVVSDNGTILQNNAEVARLGIAYSNDPSGQMVKEGNGLFRAQGRLANAYNQNNVGFTLKQGYIEGSNVDEGQTMTEMLATYRSFEANQKVLQAYDQSMNKAVNDVGKIG